MTEFVAYIAIGAASGALGFFGKEVIYKGKISTAEEKAKEIAKKAENTSREKLLESRDQAMKIVTDAKKEAEHRFRKIDSIEERLTKRESQLDSREERMTKDTQEVKQRESALEESKKTLEKKEAEILEKAEGVARMTRKEAKDMLIESISQEAETIAETRVQKLEAQTQDRIEEISKDIIGNAIGKYAQEVASEKMVTMVELSNDEIKGRIIGKEGRNINAFEKLAGVDVIIDETPNMVIISGFDLYRRYIAKKAMELLVKDGRIHPTRIEEAITTARKEADKLTSELGREAARELGITGLPSELLQIVGKLNFRTSYGQNQLNHAKEVAFIAASIADDIGADVDLCKKGALLHDIGKVVSHEVSGKHAPIGATMAKKFNIDEKVINCIEAHHEDVPFTCVEAAIVQAADAISASRPGARSEKLENYIQRLQQIEKICTSRKGVRNAYAIQAGREVRILVNPDEVSDAECFKLARETAKEIENEVAYPGTVKVQVVRESRVIEFAK